MTNFHVPEIHCEACIRSLTHAVRDLDHAATVRADLRTKQVQVVTTAADEAVAEAFREAGFTVDHGSAEPA